MLVTYYFDYCDAVAIFVSGKVALQIWFLNLLLSLFFQYFWFGPLDSLFIMCQSKFSLKLSNLEFNKHLCCIFHPVYSFYSLFLKWSPWPFFSWLFLEIIKFTFFSAWLCPTDVLSSSHFSSNLIFLRTDFVNIFLWIGHTFFNVFFFFKWEARHSNLIKYYSGDPSLLLP